MSSSSRRVRKLNYIMSGRVFDIRECFMDEYGQHLVNIECTGRITKCVRKGDYDKIYIRMIGKHHVDGGRYAINDSKFILFAHVTWTKNGPVYFQKSADTGYLRFKAFQDRVIRELEGILMETILLEETNEQIAKT